MILDGGMVPCAAGMENHPRVSVHAQGGAPTWRSAQRAWVRAAVAAGLVVPSACSADPVDVAPNGSSSEGGAPTTILPGDGEAGSSEAASTHADGSSSSSETGAVDLGVAPVDDCAAFDAFASALAMADDAARPELTSSFVAATMHDGGGLPVRCDGRLVGLLWDEGGGALSMTGDFAEWDPQAHPMVPIVEGFGLWVADIAVTEPLAPSMYKFVRDGGEYFADPWARRFAWDEFGEYSLTAARPDAPHHERYPGFVDGAGRLPARDVVVWVPAGALLPGAPPAAVMYMHDGQNLFAPDAPFGGWQVGAAVDDAITSGVLAPMFVVGIDNTSLRFDEYTPIPDDLGDGAVGGRADEYADFVALGIKPFIDARYPTRAEADSTVVLGSSLGGLVSLYIAWRHPDVFGLAGSMSGTLDWGRLGLDNDRIVELFEQQPPAGTWLYLDTGGDGPCPGGTDNYCVNLEMRGLLAEIGWVESETLVYVHAPGASHDEAAWRDRMPGVLGALGGVLGAPAPD